MSKDDNIIGFPASANFTPEQALASAGQFDLREVMVIAYDKDGELVIRSSKMNLKEALWLIKMAVLYTLDGLCCKN